MPPLGGDIRFLGMHVGAWGSKWWALQVIQPQWWTTACWSWEEVWRPAIWKMVVGKKGASCAPSFLLECASYSSWCVVTMLASQWSRMPDLIFLFEIETPKFFEAFIGTFLNQQALDYLRSIFTIPTPFTLVSNRSEEDHSAYKSSGTPGWFCMCQQFQTHLLLIFHVISL